MRLRLQLAVAVGLGIWLTTLAVGAKPVQVASADGPAGIMQPTSGPALEWFYFTFTGFQPDKPLNFEVLFPGSPSFIPVYLDLVPPVTDAAGNATDVLVTIPALFGFPSFTKENTPEIAHFDEQARVIWHQAPVADSEFRIRFKACDDLACVEFAMDLTPVTAQ